MSTFAIEIEKELGLLEPESARHFERAVREMLLMARRKGSSSGAAAEFDQMAAEEAGLREKMRQQGRTFSASDRLTRDELHDRDALR